MKKSGLGKLLCIKGMLKVSSAALAESNEYLSSWWHQSFTAMQIFQKHNAVTSSHIISLAYKHFHYGLVVRYWHNGGQWRDGAGLDFGDGMFSAESNGWRYYAVIGYNF